MLVYEIREKGHGKICFSLCKPQNIWKVTWDADGPREATRFSLCPLEPSLLDLNLYQRQNKHYDFVPLLSSEGKRETHICFNHGLINFNENVGLCIYFTMMQA